MTATYVAPVETGRPPAPANLSRSQLFGWSLVMMTSWPAATVLFCFWVTAAALSPLTLALPALVAITAAVRGYANRHRRYAERLLGEPIAAPYRPAGTGWLGRAKAVLTDRSSWRDAWWLLVHSSAGCFVATLSFSLLAGGVFYLIYPFLYAVTPATVFRQPFGFFTLHDWWQSCGLMPLGLGLLAVWFATVRPLMLAHARMTRALLR